MALYECIFVTRQDIPAQDVHKLSDKFSEIFTTAGSKIIKKEYWGLRSLAYEVKKNKKGHYVLLGVDASNDAVKEFERNCKINESVIKCLTLAVEKLDSQPSIMMQAPAKATPGSSSDEAL
ncbi:MAG: rpsF [Candidatus Midichloriaceae bacterium]|jgi:small subunit ribosomal protein S6|nr:rpsF [Candidatus Midichloriaceae bacterium]